MRLRPFVDRRISLMQVVATLDITLISALRGCDATRATWLHTEQRGNHVLREDLWEL
jgi:hypothetical protein